MWTLRFAVGMALVFGMGQSALAQRADSATIEVLEAPSFSVDSRLPLYATFAPAADRANHVTAASHLAESLKRLAAEDHKHYWPEFALGGAVVGGVGVAVLAVVNCDQGCQDDGALAHLPPFIAAGAVGGALIGAVIGLIVDSSRSSGP